MKYPFFNLTNCFIVIFLFAGLCNLHAQNTHEHLIQRIEMKSRQKAKMVHDEVFSNWEKLPKFLNDTIVPADMRSEHAVIIGMSKQFKFRKHFITVKIHETTFERIKLLDKSAVEEYATMYFKSDYYKGLLGYLKENLFGVRIIKPDGKIIDVNTFDAIDAEGTPDAKYNALAYALSDHYKKVALPGLEVGDIIDLYQQDVTSQPSQGFVAASDPVIYFLNGSEPILHQEFKFTVDRGFFINFKSFNGAPALLSTGPGTNERGELRGNVKTYYLADSIRHPKADLLWSPRYSYDPYFKFQFVYFAGNNKKTSHYFCGKANAIKSEVSHYDIINTLRHKIRNQNDMLRVQTYVSKIESYLRNNYRKESNPKIIVPAAYYYFRYIALSDYYNPPIQIPSAANKEMVNQRTQSQPFNISPDLFVGVLNELFQKRNMYCDVIFAVKNDRGLLSDVLLSDDYKIGLQVKGYDATLFPFDNHSTIQYANAKMDGADALSCNISYTRDFLNEGQSNTGTEIILASTAPNENVDRTLSTVSFSDDLEKTVVNRKVILSGYFKHNASFAALQEVDYLRQDLRHFDSLSYKKLVEAELHPNVNLAFYEEQKRKEKADKDKIHQQHMESIAQDLKGDFPTMEKVDNYQVINAGRYNDTSKLIYKEKLVLNDLMTQSGDNILFEVGKLIGKQFMLSTEQRNRKAAIKIEFAKTLENEIQLNIPQGYEADGLNDLVFKVDNPSFLFESWYEKNDKVIVVKTRKTYKTIYDNAQNWGNWLQGLDAANSFYNKKIIFKKI